MSLQEIAWAAYWGAVFAGVVVAIMTFAAKMLRKRKRTEKAEEEKAR